MPVAHQAPAKSRLLATPFHLYYTGFSNQNGPSFAGVETKKITAIPSPPLSSHQQQSRVLFYSTPSLVNMSQEEEVPQPGPARISPGGGPDEWLEAAKRCKYLPEADMKRLCEICKELLMEGSCQCPSNGWHQHAQALAGF